MRITSCWYAKHKAAHTAALAKPQNFPLTGDGSETAKVGHYRDPEQLRAALAAARYRDWQAAQANPSSDDTETEKIAK
jgi:hypothetical protein